jgi:hypothetical protein
VPMPISTKTGRPTLSPPSLPPEKKSRISPAQISAILFGMAPRFSGRSRRVDGPRYTLFWQTVAICASMLIFAALRPSTTGVTAGDTTQSTRLDSGSKELHQTVSGTRSQQTEVPKAAEAQLRQSDYFVAKDFTYHFTLHAHKNATMQKSELKRNAQGSISHMRVVTN